MKAKFLLEIEYEGQPFLRLLSTPVLLSNVQTAVMAENGDDEDFQLTGIRAERFEPGHPDHKEQST